MLNRVILMGRLTAEPDYRTTQSGVAFVRLGLAVERDFKGQNGERQTDFLNIIAWRQTADFVSKYFHKGQLVAVQGSIQTGSYTDKDGNKRMSFDIVADQVYFAEPKRDNSQQPQSDIAGTSANAPQAYDNYSNYGEFAPVNDSDLPF